MRRYRRDTTLARMIQIKAKILSMTPGEISALISAHLPGCEVTVESEDNTHFNATVVSAAFDGVTVLGRHRLVYEALGSRMGMEIHALSIQAYAPDEWTGPPGENIETPRG